MMWVYTVPYYIWKTKMQSWYVVKDFTNIKKKYGKLNMKVTWLLTLILIVMITCIINFTQGTNCEFLVLPQKFCYVWEKMIHVVWNNSWYFHHDNATAHASLVVHDVLDQNTCTSSASYSFDLALPTFFSSKTEIHFERTISDDWRY